jgi:NifU-like protein involved in Fe-S cluster formation
VNIDPYSPAVRAYFFETAHAGDLDGVATVNLAEQGIRLRLAATHDEGTIKVLRFRAWGCPHVIAACESFCSDYEGRPVTALADFRAADIMSKLSVPVEKTGRILVLEDAVRSLGQSICDDPTAS